MFDREALNPENFLFRGLHPNILMGTASDRYAGWIDQIYSAERYKDRTTRRSHAVGGKPFVEEVLPVESVEEYFEHFRALELDYTFYRPLLDDAGNPTQNYHTLKKYGQHLREGDRIILKAPQEVFAQKIRRGVQYLDNDRYLDADIFKRQFYEPALELLEAHISGFIFEQEYQRKQDRSPPGQVAASLDAFFNSIPKDKRYHVELRTEAYLALPVFAVLEKHGVGQVLSHWTWLPSLRDQFAKSGKRFLNSNRQAVLRLMTPRGVRYEDAYARAHPFRKLIEGMTQPNMVEDTVELMQTAIESNVQLHVIINNRAGGNAPMIAKRIAEQFQSSYGKSESSGR